MMLSTCMSGKIWYGELKPQYQLPQFVVFTPPPEASRNGCTSKALDTIIQHLDLHHSRLPCNWPMGTPLPPPFFYFFY